MINDRLKAVASVIDEDANIMDIGCDHALLDIFVAKTRKVGKIIASDINKGPLIGAKKNIDDYKMQDKIVLRHGDGLKILDNDIDTIVISGMGGVTINKILEKKHLKNIKCIILSPNNGISKVRKHLNKIGFELEKESLILEKNIIYIIMKAVRGNKKLSSNAIKYGSLSLRKDDLYKKYLLKDLAKVEKVLSKLPKKYLIKKIKLKKEIIDIKRIV